MKIAEAMGIIDKKWVEKKKGFRVVFQRYSGADWVDDITPDKESKPLDSDVTAWRLAWKLAESTPLSEKTPQEGDMANIRVIDESGIVVPHYVSRQEEVYNFIG